MAKEERERWEIIRWEMREKKFIKKRKERYSNCVDIHSYCNNFGYLDNFNLIDVEDFWSKMCKISYFLYFAKFYIHLYGCSNKLYSIEHPTCIT